MQLVTTPRVTFLRALADEILQQYGRGRMIVAIDGPLRSGKTRFADDLAAVLRGARASGVPREHGGLPPLAGGAGRLRRRHAGAVLPLRLRRVGAAPGARGAVPHGRVDRVRHGVFDPARDAWVEPKWITGPEDAILVLDGRFVLRAAARRSLGRAHRPRRRARATRPTSSPTPRRSASRRVGGHRRSAIPSIRATILRQLLSRKRADQPRMRDFGPQIGGNIESRMKPWTKRRPRLGHTGVITAKPAPAREPPDAPPEPPDLRSTQRPTRDRPSGRASARHRASTPVRRPAGSTDGELE